MKKIPLYTFLAAIFLSGCATTKVEKPDTLSMTNIRAANYGAYPKDYQSRIHKHLQKSLLDYDSAKIEFSLKPVKVFYTTALSFDGFHSVFRNSHGGNGWKGFPVYLVCVNVNAKNTYGGYTGWQTYQYYLQDDRWYTDGLAITGTDTYTCSHAAKSQDVYLINMATYKVNVVP